MPPYTRRMDFHGDDLQVGDRLHDVADGAMVVLELLPASNQIRVAKRANIQNSHTYNRDGRRSDRQLPTLFRHNPICVYPRKAAHDWLTQLIAIKQTTNSLATFAESAEFRAASLPVSTLFELGLLTDQQRADLELAAIERETS